MSNLRDNSYIIGHSAGATVLGTSIEHVMILHPEWNDLNLTDLSGLNMIKRVIFPHSNRYNMLEPRVTLYETNVNAIYFKDRGGLINE